MKRKVLSLTCMACLGLSLGLTSCSSTPDQADSDGTRPDNVIIGMPNPFHDCESLEEAAAITGFAITLPATGTDSVLPEWAGDIVIYRASDVNMKLLEIIYPSDENLTKEVRIRKAITEKEDMSGDYNSYDSEKEITVGETVVKAKLSGDKIALVTWCQDGYAYSVHVTDGMDEEGIKALIATIE